MKILGIGTDIVDSSRIARLIERYQDQFMKKTFHEKEYSIGGGYSLERKVGFFSKRFAAKEAFVKALGCGFVDGIKMREICVVNNDLGAPILSIEGTTKEKTEAIFGQNDYQIKISLSDDGGNAIAFIIIHS